MKKTKTKESEQMFGLNFKAEIFTTHSLHTHQQEGEKTPDKQKYMSLSLSYLGAEVANKNENNV